MELETDRMRVALVRGMGITLDKVERYLPGNYNVTAQPQVDGFAPEEGVLIFGRDSAGWTMEDYVVPRLNSGMYFVEVLR